MTAFLFSFLLFFAESGGQGGSGGGFTHFWNTYLNYPGFEAWKFINLAIFIAIMVYLLKKPLSEKFKAKREAIRADLIRAEEQRQAALAQLTKTEAKLATLEVDSNNAIENARLEAEAEKARILRETESEIGKMREQATSEIQRSAKQIKADLRRFSAEESIRLAEEKIKSQINEEKDARLVRANVQAIGGLS